MKLIKIICVLFVAVAFFACQTMDHNNKKVVGEVEFSNTRNLQGDDYKTELDLTSRYYYLINLVPIYKNPVSMVVKEDLGKNDKLVNAEIITQRGLIDIVIGFIPIIGSFIGSREVQMTGTLVTKK